MAGQQPRQTPSASKKRRRKQRRPGPVSWLLAFAALAGAGYFIFELIRINILPTQMLLMLCMIVVLLMIICSMAWLLKTRKRWSKLLMGVIVCGLGLSLGVGGYYVHATESMFNQVTGLTDQEANPVTIYAMKESGITQPDQLSASTTLGIVPQLDALGTSGAVESLEKQGAKMQTEEFDDIYSLVDALYAGDVDAIAFPEQYHDQIYEIANDTNKYNALTTFTNTVDIYIYYTDRDQETLNPADPVSNIMSDPFTVLISGNDSYGSLSNTSRSDVNMLVTVNPSTAQILLISIPRDTYTTLTCKKNPTACAAVSGEEDKLTHSGVYGIAAVESTVEDLLDISINYYVRVNFSSLINIVDAVGGVDVEVEPGLEVDTFYSNGTQGVHAGMNHLDGERALAFSRERYAYADGDNQRVKNQQIVLKALIKAMMSPSMVANYPEVMKALSTAFETNMPAQSIKSLITLELARFPKWNIQSYALVGESDMAFSAVSQDLVSVTMVSSQSIDEAKALIDRVKAGETIDIEQASSYAESVVHDEDWYDLHDGEDDTFQNSAQDDLNNYNSPDLPYGYDQSGYGQQTVQDPYGQEQTPHGSAQYDAGYGYGQQDAAGSGTIWSDPYGEADYCTLYPSNPACAY